MGASVSNFFSNVAKTVAKAGISAAGTFIPVIGPHLANHINSKFKHGGKIHKFALGGVNLKNVPPGVKTRAINTVEGLRALIRRYPNEARLAGLSLEDTYDVTNPAGREEAQEASYEGMGAGRKQAQAMEERHFAHGGMVSSLPISNLNRLNYEHGGVALTEAEGEHSFVVLHHGHPAHKAHHGHPAHHRHHMMKKFVA